MLNSRTACFSLLLCLTLLQPAHAQSSDEEPISGIGGTGYQDPNTTIEELNIPNITEIPDIPQTPQVPELPDFPDLLDFSTSDFSGTSAMDIDIPDTTEMLDIPDDIPE